ncbi:ribosome assembly cofactor RimP [Elizabethkingia ursingii]|uniref:Ribosome maturation factor RimP n=1 Tax=Elizabethkingia ursingii TaxID=1756150 RepID=A0AAJ3TPS6_9FLAO|nr:ribosome assembly cofactor RimP [Elizabethkingia ursingii]AQX08585.1 ribosome assembly cofactor RimP [Elizabethkingia ursingii]OPB77948.1 ribosome assembly cofactor RimP [Elizabethkingia ursingii]
MEFRERVQELVDQYLVTREDLFLIELKISADSNITVIIDGDQSVSLQDCLDVSRAVEFQLDREEHDFSLQVMSPGLSEPLKLPRQFAKNIGRELDILLNDDTKIQGELKIAGEDSITLELKYRRPKLVGKGKEDVVEDRIIPLTEIKKALVVIKF